MPDEAVIGQTDDQGLSGSFEPQPDALRMVPARVAHRCRAVPLRVDDSGLHVLMADPNDLPALDDLRAAAGVRIHPERVAPDTVLNLLHRHYGAPPGERRQQRPQATRSRAEPPLRQAKHSFLARLTKPSMGTQARFYRSLAQQLHAGLTLARALAILAESGPGGYRNFCLVAAETIERGEPLSAAMAARPDLFDPVHVALVRAGEKAGDLERSFQDIARHIERELESLMDMLKGAALPLAESLGFVGVGVAIGFFPSIALLISLFVIAAVPVLVRVILPLPGVRETFDFAKSVIPVFAGMTRNFAVARFCRVAGALFRAGVPLSECFRMGAEACGNSFLRMQATPLVTEFQQGLSIREAVQRMPYLPRVVQEELMTGEVAGAMDDAFHRSAEYCHNAGHNTLGVVAKVLPVILLVVYVGAAFFILQGSLSEIGDVYRDAVSME